MPKRSAEFVVLALDIGSSSTRAALFDKCGRIVPETSVRAEYRIRYTPDGGAELSPTQLRSAVGRCIRQAQRETKAPIRAITGCAFWHGLMGLDASGKPTTPILMWADGRSAADAAGLREQISEREYQLRTGCMLRAPFWPAKLRWLRRSQPSVFRRTKRWVAPSQWLFGEFFGFDAISHSMASGTGLYNLAGRGWDEEVCRMCGIDPGQLAAIADHADLGGREVFAAIGDGGASNLGSGADRPGVVAINVGTSAAVRVVEVGRGTALPFGLFRYVIDDGRNVVGGATSNGGNLREWCVRELRVAGAAVEKALSRRAAAADALAVLPFWAPERAPSWPERMAGVVTGLTQTTTRDELLRAITTSAFYRVADIFDELERARGRAEDVIVSGGIRNSRASLAILADALGRDTRVSVEPESSLRGAALYALEKLGAPVTPLTRGKIIRHNPALAEQHRARRERQNKLEATLAR